MAQNVKTNAKGNSANTGAPGPTPGPTKKVIPTAPDAVSFVRKPTPAGYGQNGPANPSSINPGQTLMSPLAANLKASSDDGEGCLDTVIARGTARRDDVVTCQLRQIADKACPPAFGMKDPNANNPKVPATLGASNGAPDKQP